MKPGGFGPRRSEIARGAAVLARKPITPSTTPMKRSAIAASSTPMVRSAMQPGAAQLARSSAMSWKPVERSAGPVVSTLSRKRRLRTRGPRMTKIRRSAQGQDCDLNIPGVCTYDTSTTVWCHSNLYADGKGLGIKANDEAGCNGCAACHAFYDGGWVQHPGWTRELVEQRFTAARAKSRLKLKQKGLVE